MGEGDGSIGEFGMAEFGPDVALAVQPHNAAITDFTVVQIKTEIVMI